MSVARVSTCEACYGEYADTCAVCNPAGHAASLERDRIGKAARLAKTSGNGKHVEQPDALPEDFAPIEPVDAVDLIETYKELREPVVDGLIRRSEIINVVGCSKSMKSYLVTDMALCKAAGGSWLDRYQMPPGRVLVIDNELHNETLADRIRKVRSARAINLERGQVHVITLRGRLRNLFQLAPTIEQAAGKYDLIIFDALYRLLPDGSDENSNTGLTAIYNQLDRYAEITNAGIVVVHHSTKGSQAEKRNTDVGAGGGSQSRACDSHLTLREHADDNAVVVMADVRSYPPIEPHTMRWTYPVWTPADELDPENLRKANGTGKQKTEEESLADLLKFVADCVPADKAVGHETIANKAQAKGWSGRDAQRSLLPRAIDSDLVEVTTHRHGRKTYRRKDVGNA